MPLSISMKVVTGVAAAAVAGLIVVGGAALAGASDATRPSAGPSSSAPDGGRAPHEHTPVTGDEADRVSAAVTAKDSAVTVTTVEKDPDGSYDVDGTRAGAPVRFDVSADLATVTERTGGPDGDVGWGGSGGRGDCAGDPSPSPSSGTSA